MPRPLTINPAPFKSSRLALPPSPFSPREPISPPPPSQRFPSKNPWRASNTPPAPTIEPLHWLWQCHLCNRVYRLGTTRRCLDDGHRFCAGTTTVTTTRNSKRKVQKHKACASEFDYAGWKAWGVWRRSLAAATSATIDSLDGEHPSRSGTRDKKDCWMSCDYPSECRWGKQHGVSTPVAMEAVVPSTPSLLATSKEIEMADADAREGKPCTTFDDILSENILFSITDPESSDYLEPLTLQSSASAMVLDDPPSPVEETKKPSMDDVLQSVKRRKQRSAGQLPSPLGSSPPSPTLLTPAQTAEVGGDREPQSGVATSSNANYLQRTFDDLEIDFRKSMDRASGLVTGWVGGLRGSVAVLEEDKVDVFVKTLRGGKRK